MTKRVHLRSPYLLHNYTPVLRAMPVPGIDSILAEPTVCVTMSEKLVPYLVGLLEIYRWKDKLAGTEEEINTALGVFQDLIVALTEGNCPPCLPGGESECTDYPADAPFISYAPNDPFQTPDFVPGGYSSPPWYHNPLIPAPGVLPGDAMVNLLALPLSAVIWEIPALISSGFPRSHIRVSGTGKVQIEFVRAFQGGLVLVTKDNGIDDALLVDLNYIGIVDLGILVGALEELFDLVVGGVTDNVLIHEVEFDTPGDHFIDITFLPNINEDVLVGFGGGIRRVTLCGFDSLGETPLPQFRIESCVLQWRPNDAAGWVNLGNVCGYDGTDGEDGADGRTLNLTADESVPGQHTLLLSYADAPEDTVVLTTILDGVDGECEDCGEVVGTEKCNVAFGVAALWIDRLQSVFGQMIIDSDTLDALNPETFDASVAAYGMTPTDHDEFRQILIDIALAYDGDAYTSFDDYMGAYGNQLQTYQVSVQCALFGLMPEGAYLTHDIMIAWMNAVEALGSGDVTEWFRVAEIGRRTTDSSFAALVNEARAFGGDYDCSVCADAHAGCFQFASLDGLGHYDGELDESFGNPAPSIHNTGSGTGGFSVSASVTVPGGARLVASVTADFYWHVADATGNPGGIVFRGASLIDGTGTPYADAAENEAPAEPQDGWFTRTFTFDSLTPATEVSITLGVTTDGGQSYGWIDNICIVYGD